MINAIPAEFVNCDLSFVIEKATSIVLRSPIETPVQTSFGIMADRPAVYLLLQDTLGHVGVGEVWCNFPACGAEHRERLLESALLPALGGSGLLKIDSNPNAPVVENGRIVISDEPGLGIDLQVLSNMQMNR